MTPARASAGEYGKRGGICEDEPSGGEQARADAARLILQAMKIIEEEKKVMGEKE